MLTSDRVTEEVDQEEMEDRTVVTKRVNEETGGGGSGTDDNQTSENKRTEKEQSWKMFHERNRKQIKQ